MNRLRLAGQVTIAAFIAVGLTGEMNAQNPSLKGEPTARTMGDTSSLLQTKLHGDEKIATPAGVIELQDSFFGPDASEKIYAEMDFQRACQCYLWSHPLVSMKTWQEEQANAFDAHGDNDFVVLQTLDEKRGVVTGNLTTPYIINFINLSAGPIVIDYPAGRTLTGFLDLWQRPFGYAGLTGPDLGKGGRYVLVGPGTNIDDVVVENASVFQSPTNNVAFTQRILDNDPEFYAKFKSEMRIGRLGKPLMECRFIEGRDAKWSGTAPRGITYWERLARLINEEPVRPIDKAWMAMLLPLGIERGTDFAPNEHQRETLLKGAAMGELMARNLQVFPRFTKPYWDGTQWYKSFDFGIEQELPERIELDERTTWFYEAVTSSKEMVTPQVGSGQVYMTTKRDSEGRMLRADKLYRLRVPKDVPAGQFWALTLYSENTRRPYDNGLNSVRSINLDSRLTDLQRNADGSVDLYIGPNAPAGLESNWMKTSGDDGWFVYFRLYAPQQPFFDKTFRLPDFTMLE
jgi:hypothetical protein